MAAASQGSSAESGGPRSALFVDFDNVYLGLRALDPAAADAFATHPGRWLARLSEYQESDGRETTRRFLVRACYLNPSAFPQFRAFFTRAGFRVVDCPSLTRQGKSGADISLVLDAVDALASSTHYDEFIILSADADFTPLVLRCREADRRTTIITAGPAASAYRAVADVVVTSDEFAEMVSSEVWPVPDDGDEDELAGGSDVRARVSPEEASAAQVSDADMSGADAAPVDAADAVALFLARTDRPVHAASAAHSARSVEPDLPATSWNGHGTFAKWLHEAVPTAGYLNTDGGYVWDAQRFTRADVPVRGDGHDRSASVDAGSDVAPGGDAPAGSKRVSAGGGPKRLSELEQQVANVTDIPALAVADYAGLLTELAHDLTRHPFTRPDTSKRVRDACQAAGLIVGRTSINFVIGGLLYSGLSLDGDVTPALLADRWSAHVEELCRGARMELTEPELAAIRAWVGGGLAPN